MSNQNVASPASSEKTKVIEPIINDVVIEVATSNGSGSQTANNVILRSLFEMGIPVTGKNMFPSNIQGLPTWFTIRANKEGWTARRKEVDFMVTMNVESVVEDIRKLPAGAALILPDDLSPHLQRQDLIPYIVPFSKLVVTVCPDPKLRKLVTNMIYVGVVAYLLEIEIDEVHRAIERLLKGKQKAIEINRNAANLGYNWSSENLQKNHPWRVARMKKDESRILIEGNMATALGLLYGGVQVVGWYPITPSSSVCENLIELLAQYRHDPQSGKATYAVVQAEDEIASIGFVVGAGWAGARAATATSGPGVSLMAEFAGLSYFAEIPAVIVDVQRMGPSTGLPTRTCQGDIMKAYFLSHGDCKHLLLIPGTPEEIYEFGAEVLNVAFRFQTLTFLMTDLDLGMNNWMSKRFSPLAKPLDRGKLLTAEELNKITKFERYADVDGDGIPYRTIPGTKHPKAGYFTRGTGHNAAAGYSEKPDDWQNNIDRLARKHDTARKVLPQPVVELAQGGSRIGIIAYGSSDPAVQESRAQLFREAGVKTDYLRIRALPASSAIYDFIANHDVVYLVEQNRDAQMASILRMEKPELCARVRSVLHYNGLPIDARSITDSIVAQQKGK